MAQSPDRLSIDKSDRQLYEQVKEDPLFHGLENTDLFLVAMAMGFRHQTRTPLTTKEGYILLKTLGSPGSFAWACVDSLAFMHGGLDMVADMAAKIQLVEEYAHAGIGILCGDVTSTEFGSYEKIFEQQLLQYSEE